MKKQSLKIVLKTLSVHLFCDAVSRKGDVQPPVTSGFTYDMKLQLTANNTTALVWKFCGKAQFLTQKFPQQEIRRSYGIFGSDLH